MVRGQPLLKRCRQQQLLVRFVGAVGRSSLTGFFPSSHTNGVSRTGPRHRVPSVVEASGMTEGGWIPVDPRNLKTRFPGVYAVGDVTSVGTPKAGVFSEGAARVVAASLITEIQSGEQVSAYDGAGSCYIEFEGDRVGRVDVIFPPEGSPSGSFAEPSLALAREKQDFGSSREARWFGLS